MKTGTENKEIEIIKLNPIHPSGAVPAEALFKVVFEYRETETTWEEHMKQTFLTEVKR